MEKKASYFCRLKDMGYIFKKKKKLNITAQVTECCHLLRAHNPYAFIVCLEVLVLLKSLPASLGIHLFP